MVREGVLGAYNFSIPINGIIRISYALFLQERTLDEQRKLVERIMQRDLKRRKRIEAAGIDYECPEIVRTKPFTFLFLHWCSYY